MAFDKMDNSSLPTLISSPILQNSVTESDFFEGVFSPLMPTEVIVFVIGWIIGVLGSLIIIWYERNCDNRYRTVINQIFARFAWYLLAYAWLIYLPEAARFLHGPYNDTFCDAHVILRNILWQCVLLTLNVILILRYVFIFTLKNFAVINDDVLARLLNMSVLLVAIWTAIVKRMTPGKLPLTYYLCSGKDPNGEGGNFIEIPQKYNTGRIVLIVSAILHLLMTPRIWYYQLVTERTEQPLQLGTIDNNSTNGDSDSQRPTRRSVKSFNNSKTILDMVTHIVFLLVCIALGLAIKITDVVEPKNYNLEKYRFIPHIIQIYTPCLAYIAMHSILFTRNAKMRQGILKKIKSHCKRNQIGIEE